AARGEQHKATDAEGLREEASIIGKIVRNRRRARLLEPCERDMRSEVARLRRQAGAARGALMGSLQPLKALGELDAGDQGARLVAAKRSQPLDGDIETVELDLL